jgi:hypothetical protein
MDSTLDSSQFDPALDVGYIQEELFESGTLKPAAENTHGTPNQEFAPVGRRDLFSC